MARFNKTDRRLWADGRFLSLSDRGRMLWLYLLTGPEVTSLPGVLVVTRQAIADILRIPPRAFDNVFAELGTMARADWRHRLVWLPKGPVYNRPANEGVLAGWRDLWAAVPECTMKGDIHAHLKQWATQWGPSYLEQFRHSIGDHIAYRSTHGEQEQKQEQEQKHPPPPPGAELEIPPALDSPEFRTSWLAWCLHRREKRCVVTPIAGSRALKSLAAMGLERAHRAIEHSIEKGYQGIFEPTGAGGRPPPKQPFSGIQDWLKDQAGGGATDGNSA